MHSPDGSGNGSAWAATECAARAGCEERVDGYGSCMKRCAGAAIVTDSR